MSKKSKKTEQQERSERFYKWLEKCRNIHLHDSERVLRACELITV